MGEEKKNQWYGLKPKWVPEWVSITFVVFVAFTLLMLFYGESSYLKTSEYAKQISELKREIKENHDTAQVYMRKVNELNTDRETLERIASARKIWHEARKRRCVYHRHTLMRLPVLQIIFF